MRRLINAVKLFFRRKARKTAQAKGSIKVIRKGRSLPVYDEIDKAFYDPDDPR